MADVRLADVRVAGVRVAGCRVAGVRVTMTGGWCEGDNDVRVAGVRVAGVGLGRSEGEEVHHSAHCVELLCLQLLPWCF